MTEWIFVRICRTAERISMKYGIDVERNMEELKRYLLRMESQAKAYNVIIKNIVSEIAGRK